jgi:uncharacterized protein (TIGR03000 family)
MIRTVLPLAAALVACAAASAQPAAHIGRGGRFAPQPAGVIPTPSLPFPGAPGAPSPTSPIRPLPRSFLRGGGWYDPWGYSAYWPVWYDTDPVPTVANPVVPVYVPVPQPVTIPQPPPDVRARLALTVPSRAHVWLSGKEVDPNVSPLILESPPLQPGQSYTFDLKVTWPSGGKTEERTRTVKVDAGDQKTLAYFE